MVGSSGLEPPTSRLSGVRSNQLSYEPMVSVSPLESSSLSSYPKVSGGDERVRTAGLLLARQALYQLSYTPMPCCFFQCTFQHTENYIVRSIQLTLSFFSSLFRFHPRKEVIQPHLPIRLPCYDFTPVIGLTFDGSLLTVRIPASGAPNSHGVTGGVYKARERIHRGMLIRDY